MYPNWKIYTKVPIPNRIDPAIVKIALIGSITDLNNTNNDKNINNTATTNISGTLSYNPSDDSLIKAVKTSN